MAVRPWLVKPLSFRKRNQTVKTVPINSADISPGLHGEISYSHQTMDTVLGPSTKFFLKEFAMSRSNFILQDLLDSAKADEVLTALLNSLYETQSRLGMNIGYGMGDPTLSIIKIKAKEVFM